MNDYITDARQIVAGYWTACEGPEKVKADVTARRQANEITEEFERRVHLEQNNAMLRAREEARGKLRELGERFAENLERWNAPKAADMGSDDYKLLAANFPLTLEEYRALLERNRGNATVLRKAVEYGKDPVHPWAPYAAAVYALPDKRMAAFADVLRVAKVALDSDRQHSSALNDRYWSVLTDSARAVIGAAAQHVPAKDEKVAEASKAAADWYRHHEWNGTTWEYVP